MPILCWISFKNSNCCAASSNWSSNSWHLIIPANITLKCQILSFHYWLEYNIITMKNLKVYKHAPFWTYHCSTLMLIDYKIEMVIAHIKAFYFKVQGTYLKCFEKSLVWINQKSIHVEIASLYMYIFSQIYSPTAYVDVFFSNNSYLLEQQH